VIQTGEYPDLFEVSDIVAGASIAKSPAAMGCKMPSV
jgi:branched-chain amino acid transport system substrate-binding protein